MAGSLPPGVWVRYDAANMQFLRAALVGAADTPYENGVFVFDIYVPPEYPAVPPMFNLMTTARNTFRFNANLYHDGKVCLSLLGTWQGPGWDPAVSSLLQVFLSIQSMIMCSDPWYVAAGDNTCRVLSVKKHNSALGICRVSLTCFPHFFLPLLSHCSFARRPGTMSPATSRSA